MPKPYQPDWRQQAMADLRKYSTKAFEARTGKTFGAGRRRKRGSAKPSATNPNNLNPERMRKMEGLLGAEIAKTIQQEALVTKTAAAPRQPTLRSQINPMFLS